MHDCHEIGQTPLAFCYLLAEQNSPLYQFSIRAHKVNTVLEYHKSADELVIPPTYQPGLREFIDTDARNHQQSAQRGRDTPVGGRHGEGLSYLQPHNQRTGDKRPHKASDGLLEITNKILLFRNVIQKRHDFFGLRSENFAYSINYGCRIEGIK